MKISQEAREYRPITIVLQSEEEAKLFVEIMDVFGNGGPVSLDSGEFARRISDAFTNMEVTI